MNLTGDAFGTTDLKFGPSVFVGDGKVEVPPTTAASLFCSQLYVNTSPAVPTAEPVNLKAVLIGIMAPEAVTVGLGFVTARLVLTGQVLVSIFDCICKILLYVK
jgi:hypothetical protein